MSFLRRLLGGSVEASAPAPPTPAEVEEDERQHELDLLRGEAERLDDLQQPQLRYADRAWTPPDQGGERRADDEVNAAEK